MGAHSGNTHKAIPTEMPDTKFEIHQTNISAPPSPGGLPPPPPRAGKPGGQRVGGAFYGTWRAGSIVWRLARNKAYYAVLAVQASFPPVGASCCTNGAFAAAVRGK